MSAPWYAVAYSKDATSTITSINKSSQSQVSANGMVSVNQLKSFKFCNFTTHRSGRMRFGFTFLYLMLFVACWGSDPILFIENKGQWAEEVRFRADIPYGKLYVLNHGLRYEFTPNYIHDHDVAKNFQKSLEVRFISANKQADITGKEPLNTTFNYYHGRDWSSHATGCKAFKEVIYSDIQEGIDFRLYSWQGNIKYDLIVHQGADISGFNMQYDGDQGIYLEDGCSFIDMEVFTIMENRPVAYQVDQKGCRRSVKCEYELSGKRLAFRVDDDYRPDHTLVIDPELIFSTFSGSFSDNFGYSACFDDEGNLYSGGIVFGEVFPGTDNEDFGGGGYDVAILKYDSSGSDLLYGTFLGGTGNESPHSLVVNNNNELVILGTTGSTDFPVSGDAYSQDHEGGTFFSIFGDYDQGSDLFIAKLDQSGQLLKSTLIGGPGNDGILKLNRIGNYQNELIYNYGDYQRGDVIVDKADNIYVASFTDSVGFPITSMIQPAYGGGNSDALVFSLNSALNDLRWSTFFGGSGDDAAYSIKLDSSNRIILGGGTTSKDFPTTDETNLTNHQGDVDGFISILDLEGDSLVASTYLGTSTYDQVFFIDIDTDGNLFAFGQTAGAYPVTPGKYSNTNSSQFIHKFSPSLQSLFSTVIGSKTNSPNISPTAFLVNECNNLYLSGWAGNVNNNSGNVRFGPSTTTGMPVTSDAFQSVTDGSDFYLMVLAADVSELLYATFFGSTNNGGDHVDGGTSRFDKRGIIYQSVCSCGGSADDFPTTARAWSTINRGVNANGTERCNNAAFKFDLATLDARFVARDIEGQSEISSGCVPLEVQFINRSIGGEVFDWDFGDGTIMSTTSREPIQHTFSEEGTFKVALTARDENTCINSDQANLVITVFKDEISVGADVTICQGESTQLSVSGSDNVVWSPASRVDDPESTTPLATPFTSTLFTVEAVTPNGCLVVDSLFVEVTPAVVERFEVTLDYDCSDVSYEIFNNTQFNGGFLWDFGDGTTSTEQNPTHRYHEEGIYIIGLTLEGPTCVEDRTVEIDHKGSFIPNVFTPNNDQVNDFFEIKTPAESIQLTIINRAGAQIFHSDDYKNDWDGEDHPAGVYYYQVEYPNGSKCSGWVNMLK